MKKVCARVQVRSAAGLMLEAFHPSPNSKISKGEGWGEQREETEHNTHQMQASHIYILKYGLVCV